MRYWLKLLLQVSAYKRPLFLEDLEMQKDDPCSFQATYNA